MEHMKSVQSQIKLKIKHSSGTEKRLNLYIPICSPLICKWNHPQLLYQTTSFNCGGKRVIYTGTVLSTKSDSDSMFVYKVIMNL